MHKNDMQTDIQMGIQMGMHLEVKKRIAKKTAPKRFGAVVLYGICIAAITAAGWPETPDI